MNKKGFLITVLLAGLLLSACATTTTEPTVVEEAGSAVPVLTLSGSVEAAWTAEQLNAMTQTDADYTDKEGNTTTYTGVLVSDLLAAAGAADYTKLTLIASDEYSAEVTADELATCAACIVAFDEDGTLRSVMPDLSGKQNVKDLIKITVE